MNNDLISREALKEELELSKYIVPNDLNRLLNSEINRCIEAIDNAPTVEIPCNQIIWEQGYECGKNERPQGEWIEGWDGYFETLDCSLCGYVRNERHLRLNFCPNCGAKMKGGAE